MSWKECTLMSERAEFVRRALEGRTTFTALCEVFGVTPKTAYKVLKRFKAEGPPGLRDRSRRPHHSPKRTPSAMEAVVCEVRREHPVWGGRKIHHLLRQQGASEVPAYSTVTDILKRNDLLPDDRRQTRDLQRFEEAEPNALWQMDFKGHFATAGGRCNPLTVLDDHSRFSLCLKACPDQSAESVKAALTRVFQEYGLPRRMLMDNGSPWGSDQAHPHTHLTAWLMELDIYVSHGRPYHPQTQGKEERFHRTLKAELLRQQTAWSGLDQVQLAFDLWRDVYNYKRPHQAIGDQPPASRYLPSQRVFPSVIRPFEYEPGDEVRRVQDKGRISFRGRTYLVSRAFIGKAVALRASEDGRWDVFYCNQRVRRINLTPPANV